MSPNIRSISLAIASALALAVFSACGTVLGLPDPAAEEEEGGANDASSTPGEAGHDARPIELAACPGKAGYVCTLAPIPSGWSLVSHTADVTRPCPAKYGTPEEVLGDVQGEPRSCKCSCTGAPSCTTFSLMRYPKGGGCDVASVNTAFTGYFASPASLGACQAGGYTTPTDVGVLRLVAAPSPEVCGAVVDPGVRAPVTGGRGRVCSSLAGESVAPCPTGVCVPEAPAPYVACIAGPGVQSCPAGFARRTIVGTGAPAFTDTRECGPCTCGMTGICSAAIEFNAQGDCAGAGPTINTVSCRTEGALVPMVAHKFTQYSNGRSCTVSAPSTPTGGVAPNAPRTICCP